MKMFIATLFCLVVVAHAGPKNKDAEGEGEASTGDVTVKFNGSSGGMKLYPSNNEDSFIMVQQKKLEEVDADGRVVKSLNVAGQNSWTALETEEVDGATVYSTTFNVEDRGVVFSLSAHLARETTSYFESYECSNCGVAAPDSVSSGGRRLAGYSLPTPPPTTVAPATTAAPVPTSGTCQDEAGVCSSPDEAGACAEGSTACGEEVTITEDTLKFSITVSGWTFADPANKLQYALALSSKGGSSEESEELDEEGDSAKRIDVDGGYVELPTTGKIVGGDAEQNIDVSVSTGSQGGKSMIYFEFPSFGEGETLYYDPTLGVSAAADMVPSAMLLALLSAAALFL